MREAFPNEWSLARGASYELDERGFLPLSFAEELSQKLQHRTGQSWANRSESVKTFDPPGIFASNLREAFLLQLETVQAER